MERSNFFFLWLLIVIGCSNSTNEKKSLNSIKIFGTIENPKEGLILLKEITSKSYITIDTINIKKDNSFLFAFDGAPGFYQLDFYGGQSLTIILDKSDIELTITGVDTKRKFEVKGSIEYDQLLRLNQSQLETFGEREREINQRYALSRKKEDAEGVSLAESDYRELFIEKEKLTIQTIKEMETNLATFQLISSLDKDRNFSFVDSMSVALSKKYPEVSFVQDLVKQMEKARVTAIGAQAPEISLPTPEGNVLKLSALKGQIVLIDFWAQWCRPCRIENPNIVATYKKFKDKGFTVYSVSLDRTKEKWIQGIQEDNLTWHHVSDLKYFNSIAAQTYGITGIPFSILLDRNGVILAKNLRGRMLGKTLEQLFSEENK